MSETSLSRVEGARNGGNAIASRNVVNPLVQHPHMIYLEIGENPHKEQHIFIMGATF